VIEASKLLFFAFVAKTGIYKPLDSPNGEQKEGAYHKETRRGPHFLPAEGRWVGRFARSWTFPSGLMDVSNRMEPDGFCPRVFGNQILVLSFPKT